MKNGLGLNGGRPGGAPMKGPCGGIMAGPPGKSLPGGKGGLKKGPPGPIMG